jgi:hypothetical protein
LESLSFERLLDWLEGRLTAAEAATVAAQVAQADRETQAALTWLQQFQQISQSGVLTPLPTHVRAKLFYEFDQWVAERTAPKPAQAAGWWRSIKAQLNFDSYNQVALVGVRSAATQTVERQLVYNGRIAEIALNIYTQQSRQEMALWGQVFSVTETNLFSVQILQDGMERGLTTTDELGEFAFHALKPGLYDLIVSGDEGEIVIGDLPLNP